MFAEQAPRYREQNPLPYPQHHLSKAIIALARRIVVILRRIYIDRMEFD